MPTNVKSSALKKLLSAEASPISSTSPPKKLIQLLFIFLFLLCIWPRVDTPIALVTGILFSFVLKNPFPKLTSKLSKILLQVSVAGLGFGLGIGQVIQEGRKSIIYTAVGIAIILLTGRLIGKILKVNPNISQLISFGTAICGGSAIAAIAPVIKAKDDEVAVSLATIFTLNSVALILFPFVGRLIHLSQDSFGLWAALAIHDTSSVVGASASFGAVALAIATTVKLTRALWITPVVLGFAFFRKANKKINFPFFFRICVGRSFTIVIAKLTYGMGWFSFWCAKVTRSNPIFDWCWTDKRGIEKCRIQTYDSRSHVMATSKFSNTCNHM
jgi:uncharacterized integral membrane protein (TIGR00698 family)